MPKVEQIELTQVPKVVRELGRITRPMDVVLNGQVVGRMVPPGELSNQEKTEILRKGWAFVERARAHNSGVSEQQIAAVVNRAVKRVRAVKK